MKKSTIITAALALAFIAPAHAQMPSVNEIFGHFGFTTEASIDHGSCQITGTTDKQVFLEKVPVLQKLGLLNQDLTETDINMRSNQLALGFTMQMTTVATKETFEKNPSIGTCSFVMNLKEADVYGHPTTVRMISYSFNRAIFDKIDWLHFIPTNMMKVAQQFSISPEMKSRFATEGE
jgi:hypothetical protein